MEEAIKIMRMQELRDIFGNALNSAEEYDNLHKNLPLNKVSRIERVYRKLFLDCEEIAGVSHEFYVEYAKKYPFLLTQDANKIVDSLSNMNNPRFYITEMYVPQTGNIAVHKTEIDIASFYDAGETMRTFEYCVMPRTLSPLHTPRQKGEPANKYWSTRAHSERHIFGKIENTVVKIRKRVHGAGYSLEGLTDEEIRGLVKKYGEQFMAVFAS